MHPTMPVSIKEERSMTAKIEKKRLLRSIVLAAVLMMAAAGTSYSSGLVREEPVKGDSPLYINDILFYKHQLLVSEKGKQRITLYSADGKEMKKCWQLSAVPTGIAATASDIYVTTEHGGGAVVIINTENDRISKPLLTGSGACAPVLDRNRKFLYVCNRFQNTLSRIDLNSRRETGEIRMVREPVNALLSPDGKYLFVANFLNAGSATGSYEGACISVVATDSFEKIKDIQLVPGSNALQGMSLSPDRKYILVAHNLGRFQIPTSQLQQGWMNSSAVSFIALEDQKYGGTIVLDEADRGSAGIWDIACTEDRVVTTHSGSHEVCIIDYPALMEKYSRCADKSRLAYDIRFMNGLMGKYKLAGNGPRNMALHDGVLYIPTYFSDTLNRVSINDPEGREYSAMLQNRVENAAQKGEKYFNDATYCFQNWQSCSGCHPGDARTDGLNWDNLNDGIGNPKNCKSMLYSIQTPPSMISGVRPNAETAIRTGFKYIQFYEVSEEIASCVEEYIKNLRPVPSPYLVNGKLSKEARSGKKIFENCGCADCHSGIYHTDGKMYRIGTDIEFEKGWDTPSLCEVWRTAPYLFDGRAAVLKEVFSIYGHGLKGKKLSEKEMDQLVEYVNSL